MTIDTKQLAQDIARVMELDVKRTQGTLVVHSLEHPGDIYTKEKGKNHWVARCFADKKYEPENGKFYIDALTGAQMKEAAAAEIKANAHYFAAAPLMADIIRRQQDVIRELAESQWLMIDLAKKCYPTLDLSLHDQLNKSALKLAEPLLGGE